MADADRTQPSPQADAEDTAALAESLRDAVGRFVRAVRAHSDTQSTAQTETLAFLERSGPLSIAALAEGRGVKHQSMRLLVARLEALGWVARRPDPDDRRGVLLTVTGQGAAQLATDRAARAGWLADALAADFDADELATLREAVSLMNRITERR